MFIYQHECGLVATEWTLYRSGYTILGDADCKDEALEILRENYTFFDSLDIQDFLNDNWIW